MSLPPIGIVISTYQRPDGKTPDLLKRTLNSVLNQTYNNFSLGINEQKDSNSLLLI